MVNEIHLGEAVQCVAFIRGTHSQTQAELEDQDAATEGAAKFPTNAAGLVELKSSGRSAFPRKVYTQAYMQPCIDWIAYGP